MESRFLRPVPSPDQTAQRILHLHLPGRKLHSIRRKQPLEPRCTLQDPEVAGPVLMRSSLYFTRPPSRQGTPLNLKDRHTCIFQTGNSTQPEGHVAGDQSFCPLLTGLGNVPVPVQATFGITCTVLGPFLLDAKHLTCTKSKRTQCYSAKCQPYLSRKSASPSCMMKR